MSMSTDPLKKYEISPSLPPRQRLKNAGEALAPKARRRINWPIIVVVIALVVATALLIALIAK